MSLLDLCSEVQVGIGEVDSEEFLGTLAQSLEQVRFTLYQRAAQLRLDKRPPKSDLQSIPTLAAMCSVKPGTLYRRAARGEFPVTRIGNCIRATYEDVTRVRGKRQRVVRLA